MKYFFILIFTLLFSFASTAKKTKLTPKQIEEMRWNKILRLVNEEMATINKVKRKSQKLEYRLFELMSEKVKLFKEKENKEFVKLKLKHGNKITRKQIFKETLKLYNQANAYGHNLLRRYPNTRYKAAIFYTLALNSRDFSYDNNELKFLRKALEFSRTGQQVNYLARTSLAEYYYNNKQWKSAIYQYDIVLNNKDDEWFTKNLLNYGWCKLKNQEFKDAIVSLEKSFLLSKESFYINVQEQAMKGLISFYVLGKDINRGINFINKHSDTPHGELLELARKSSAKGFFKEANQISLDLVSRIDKVKESELFTDLKLFQFEMYNQYQKKDKLLNVAKEFNQLKFNEAQKEDAIQKISTVVGAKQIILKKDYSKYNKDYDQDSLKEIITYFDILRNINPTKKHEYEYFQAETYYSVELYVDSLGKYKESLNSQGTKKVEVDLREKNLDGLFSCIDLIDYKKTKFTKDQELEFAYNTYLSHWPKTKKAQDIYPRLYSLYLKDKKYEKTNKALAQYIKHFPSDIKKHRELFKLKLDLIIADKDTDRLAVNINQMAQGFLKFKNTELKKSETILANLLFSKFQKMKKDGDLKKALNGYKSVFYKDSYPRSIRGESAFNMGMIYTDLEDNSNAFKWYRKSFKFLSKKEISKKRIFLEKMALRTALLHNFLNAAKLERFILHSFCYDKAKNSKNFENSILHDLANDYTRRALYTYKKYQKCIPSVSHKIKTSIIDHLFQQKHEAKLISFVNEYKLLTTHRDKVTQYYERLYWKYFNSGDNNSQTYYSLLQKIQSPQTERFFKSQLKLTSLRRKIANFQRTQIIVDTKKPNPEKFIQDLTKRINTLKTISDYASSIFAVGNAQVTILAYDELINVSKNFALEVGKYHIPIPDPNFQKQFQSEINNIASNLNTEVSNLKNNAQSLIEKYDLLISTRTYSNEAFDILEISDIRTPASTFGVTIGLGEK